MRTGNRGIDQFRVVQRKIDYFEIHIKKKSEAVDEKSMEKELVEHLRKVLNLGTDDVTLKIEFEDNIPIDKTGKFSAVVSMVKKPPA
jgi:acyl-CoA synthetase (AMP-forming)/AMP-acid ligase II